MNDEKLDEFRSSLTPYESNDDVTTCQNTVSTAYPAYEKPFGNLVVYGNDYDNLELGMMPNLCVTQRDGDMLLFTHKQEE